MTGVMWGGLNEFVIWNGYSSIGLTLKPSGDAVISGSFDVSVSNARTSIKAYSTMDGYTSYIELEAKWNSQGYLNFEPIGRERIIYS